MTMMRDAASNPLSSERGNTFFRTIFVPLFLMLVSPLAIQFVWIVCHFYDGSLIHAFRASPLRLWQQYPTPTTIAASLVVFFLLFQLILLLIIPGPTFVAIPTPMGNRPKYTLNGVPCFLLTHFLLAASAYTGLIRYGALFDSFGPILAFLNKIALIVTIALYIRGIYYPTNSDSGVSGYGFIWDIWHGTELHPEIRGVSLKQLINCRFAMMGWSVAIVAFSCKQIELYGHLTNSMLISTSLQMVYIFKFFMWEGGYFNSVRKIHHCANQ